MKIGIIGTGFLGKAVASRLLGTGYKLTIFNRTREKTEDLKKLGATITEHPREVAEASDLVITVVKDSAAMQAVSFDRNGIIYGKHEGLTIADMSTIDLVSSRIIAKKFLDEGIEMMDTPVMGGPNLAEKGELVVMVGGKRKTYEKYKQVFIDIGNKIFYLGENGTAHAMKLALNLQISLLALSLSEGIILARKSGLDPHTFLEVLNSTYFKTGMSLNKGPKMTSGRFEPTFTLKMMKKDLDAINKTAKDFAAYLPMAKLADELYQNAMESGFGELDYTGILAFLEKGRRLEK